jgi:hypothetical protein
VGSERNRSPAGQRDCRKLDNSASPGASSISIIDDAISLLDRGISVVPMIRDTKMPRMKWKPLAQHRMGTDEARSAFAEPGTGVAVISGRVSGNLAVRDFDSVAAYDRWRDRRPALAAMLPTVRTRRGFHIWAVSDHFHIVPGIDGEFRGLGLSMAPHSPRTDGKLVEWVNPLPAGEIPTIPHAELIGDYPFSTGNPQQPTGGQGEPPGDKNTFCLPLPTSATYPCKSMSAAEVIESTLPAGPGERNARLLDLARGLRFNAGMAGASSDELHSILRRWWELAKPSIRTRDLDSSWIDFRHAFSRAKYPLGGNVLTIAALNVDPNDLPECSKRYDSTPVKQLVGLCFELSKMTGGVFFLSSHEAAERVSVAPSHCWKMLNMLVDDGVLTIKEHGTKRRATRYRFTGSL